MGYLNGRLAANMLHGGAVEAVDEETADDDDDEKEDGGDEGIGLDVSSLKRRFEDLEQQQSGHGNKVRREE